MNAPKEVEEYEFRSFVRNGHYYDLWQMVFNGTSRTLRFEPGEHFDSDPASFRSSLKSAAKTRGYTVQTATEADGSVVVGLQAPKKGKREAEPLTPKRRKGGKTSVRLDTIRDRARIAADEPDENDDEVEVEDPMSALDELDDLELEDI